MHHEKVMVTVTCTVWPAFVTCKGVKLLVAVSTPTRAEVLEATQLAGGNVDGAVGRTAAALPV
jgi:hypothetical protein